MAVHERATRSHNNVASPEQILKQITRTAEAHAAVERACFHQMLQNRYAERRVAAAVETAATETARLAAMCGSIETAARVVSLQPDEVRRLIRRAQRSEQQRTEARQAREARYRLRSGSAS